ncbi:hypothetical protein [Candidatus Rhabdochlamydia sp. T3358]|uniref:hypothetical protein n=1 Tax=Candidatus Rhabdochlamydia sp. T3358 TaxID=2099795 RepID=UPI0010B6CA2A|nr:hypothetical protein [Candidatus Rhabdochlamydia sp. T3358]VHN99582.1 hypothetical protein RHT_00061 [Candidatus Rhabdochlamydia sp. T3358]
MKITSHFYTRPSFADRALTIKDWVYNATEVFIQFCTERIWHYLEQDYLQPHLKKINDLCISEENSPLLEVHLTNICIVLEKNPSLTKTYIDLAQEVKNISPDLLEIYQIANEYPELLKTHLQTIQKAKELKSSTPLLEIYLRTVKKCKNSPDKDLSKQICGAFTCYQNFKTNRSLQGLFLATTSHIWNLKKELAEYHLQSMYNLCNFKPLMLGSHLTINHLICSDTQILEAHLNNINSIPLQFLEDYLNISFSLKDDPTLLKLYIHISYIIRKGTALDAHQQNTQTICKLQPHTLKAYLDMILYLENTHLLERYIHGIYNINYTNNTDLLASHFQKMHSIYHFNKELLEPHFQNTCHLCLYLRNYMQNVYNTENDQDVACVIYSMHNVTYLSQLHPTLLDTYLVTCQNLRNYQGKIAHNCNTYFISQKNSDLLETYLKTTLFLQNTYSSLFYLHLENIKNICKNKPTSLNEYVSTVNKWIETNKEISLLFYINHTYSSYFILQNNSELTSLYHETYELLDSKQEDLYCHMCNICSITQSHPHLLKDYLETTLLFINTHSNLLWPHLQNTQNIYASDASFPEYISKILNLKNNQESLIIHIGHIFNIHRLSKQHPLLLPLYHLTFDALESHLESQSYHVYNTYRISILLTQYLKRYLNTIQKVIPVWMSQNKPKCSWLNNQLQSIQRFSFEDTSALQKHLQLISQIDPIFEGRSFLIEEILKNMQEEERKEFISTSPEIMPYIIAKSIFLYGFHPKYHALVPCFFEPKVQQEIAIFRKESHKYNIFTLEKIFTNAIVFANYWNEEMPEDDTRAVAKKMQNLWIDATQGENNLFMQCWKEAAKTLEI